MKKKIVFITGNRAEYGIIKNILRKASNNKYFEPLLIVLGSHENHNFGKAGGSAVRTSPRSSQSPSGALRSSQRLSSASAARCA